MSLVSIETAARHLRLSADEYEADGWDETDEGQDIASKLEMAEGIVLDYLKHPEGSDDWDVESTPPPVRAAVLIVLSDLFEHRAGSAGDDVFISASVKSLLNRFRDPALA